MPDGELIPKVFHQYWTDPRNCGRPLPADVAENRKTWKRLYPEFSQSRWTDEALPDLLSDVEGVDVWSHAALCRLPAMRADIVRLGLVFQLGGFWGDLKNRARQRIHRTM